LGAGGAWQEAGRRDEVYIGAGASVQQQSPGRHGVAVQDIELRVAQIRAAVVVGARHPRSPCWSRRHSRALAAPRRARPQSSSTERTLCTSAAISISAFLRAKFTTHEPECDAWRNSPMSARASGSPGGGAVRTAGGGSSVAAAMEGARRGSSRVPLAKAGGSSVDDEGGSSLGVRGVGVCASVPCASASGAATGCTRTDRPRGPVARVNGSEPGSRAARDSVERGDASQGPGRRRRRNPSGTKVSKRLTYYGFEQKVTVRFFNSGVTPQHSCRRGRVPGCGDRRIRSIHFSTALVIRPPIINIIQFNLMFCNNKN